MTIIIFAHFWVRRPGLPMMDNLMDLAIKVLFHLILRISQTRAGSGLTFQYSISPCEFCKDKLQ